MEIGLDRLDQLSIFGKARNVSSLSFLQAAFSLRYYKTF